MSPALMTSSGIGALTIGMTARAVHSRCRVLRDTLIHSLESESDERFLLVDVGGDTVQAEIDDSGRVYRIALDGAAIRTSDSLGVGSSVASLLAHRAQRVLAGEGSLFVLLAQHCGLSFQLAYDPAQDSLYSLRDRALLAALPQATTVEQVLIVGCHH